MKHLDWYFDFVSGYAYLQFEMLNRLPADVAVEFKPILFAGLLNHFGHTGPAELPPKRQHTYQHWVWLGKETGVGLTMPPRHPFNSLATLRLAIAADCDRAAIGEIFRFIWQEGRDTANPESIDELAGRLSIPDAADAIGADTVKAQLRSNTEEAADRGVFGVPTSIVDDHLFWGMDTTDMLIAYLDDPSLFDDSEYQRVANLPIGATRK